MELLRLETAHLVLELYIWLSYRFPERFPDKDIAMAECEDAVELIARSLTNLPPTSLLDDAEDNDKDLAEVSQAKGKYPRRFRDIKKVRYVVDYSNARRRNGVFKSVPIN